MQVKPDDHLFIKGRVIIVYGATRDYHNTQKLTKSYNSRSIQLKNMYIYVCK